MQEARYYTVESGGIRCTLCPHNCLIKEGKRGICQVRINLAGSLISENYGQLCSVSSDPIEKKPLYHFHPGKNILSIGTLGCNLKCKFCQNYHISQMGWESEIDLKIATPEAVVTMAKNRPDNVGIAYTYNEPVIWYEFMLDTAKKIKEAKMCNVMVTNGYINPEPLEELLHFIDAFSVDLKAFSEDYYKRLTSSTLAPVLSTLKQIRESGKHLEITHLLVSNQNDKLSEFKDMINWICNELGSDTVLHISRYFPTYKLKEPMTSEKILLEFFEIASKKMPYVYLGNIKTNTGQNTYCKSCKSPVISRSGYSTRISGMDKNGNCQQCGESILRPANC